MRNPGKTLDVKMNKLVQLIQDSDDLNKIDELANEIDDNFIK